MRVGVVDSKYLTGYLQCQGFPGSWHVTNELIYLQVVVHPPTIADLLVLKSCFHQVDGEDAGDTRNSGQSTIYTLSGETGYHTK